MPERAGALSLDVASVRKPVVRPAQISQYQQGQPTIKPIARLLLSAHFGQAMFGTLEDFRCLDILPIRVQVGAALDGIASTCT